MIKWRTIFFAFALQKRVEILNNNGIKDVITSLLKEVLSQESLDLDETELLQNVCGWDSIVQISFIASIEDFYSITFSLQELEEVSSISVIAHIIERKLNI